MRAALAIATLGLAGLGAGQLAAAPGAPDGAQVYMRCAACHTASGKGVPGAYPPLCADFRAMAAKPAGRRYLALVVTRGLAGPLTIEGKNYNGVMPAQSGLDDAAVAAVLSHVGSKIAGGGAAFPAFTAAEVAKARASGASLSGAEVAKLHAALGGK